MRSYLVQYRLVTDRRTDRQTRPPIYRASIASLGKNFSYRHNGWIKRRHRCLPTSAFTSKAKGCTCQSRDTSYSQSVTCLYTSSPFTQR